MKTPTFLITTLMTTLSFPNTLRAEKITEPKISVNLKDASFHMSLPLKEAPGLELKYSSRSLFQGLFGRGWCSNLDLRIERKNDLSLILHSCDDKLPYEGRRMTRWMATDSEFFESVYATGSETPDQIEITTQNYVRRKGEDTWIFTKDGRLDSIATNQLKAKRTKASAGDEFLIESLERTASLHIQGGLFRGLRTLGTEKVRFLYKKGQLEQILPVRPGDGQPIRFQYDTGGNMTGAGPTEIEYDRRTDRVTAVRNPACLETFEYQNLTKGPQNGPFDVLETESRVFETCGGQRRLKTRMAFEFQSSKNGGVILIASVTDTPTGRLRTLYDPITGAPTQVLPKWRSP